MPPHCWLAYSTLQTAAQLERGESPITLLSRDEESNQKMRENWISNEKWKEEAVYLSFSFYPVELSGRFFVPVRRLSGISPAAAVIAVPAAVV